MGNFWGSSEKKRTREPAPGYDCQDDDLHLGQQIPEWVKEQFDLSSQCRRRTDSGSEIYKVYKFVDIGLDDAPDIITTICAVDDVITEGWLYELNYQSSIPVTNEEVKQLMGAPIGTPASDLPDTFDDGMSNDVWLLSENGWVKHADAYVMDTDGVQTVIIDNKLTEVDMTTRNMEWGN